MTDEEIMIYREQLIGGYISTGMLCPAIERCIEVLPDESELKERVTNCLDMLMTGNPVSMALDVIGHDNMGLQLIHDVIADCDETGKEHREVFNFLLYISRGGILDAKDDIILLIAGIATYTAIWGFHEAIKRLADIMQGELHQDLRKLARKLESEDAHTLCGLFLSEKNIPEIRFCMMTCLRMDDEEPQGSLDMIASACRSIYKRNHQTTDKNPKRKYRKGIAAATFAAVWILVMAGIVKIADDSKENSLRKALTQSMSVTVAESMNIAETNQMLAVFMQNMLKNVDDDIDLTVRICDMDEQEKVMDVEATGEYDLSFGGRRSVTVRRRLAF